MTLHGRWHGDGRDEPKYFGSKWMVVARLACKEFPVGHDWMTHRILEPFVEMWHVIDPVATDVGTREGPPDEIIRDDERVIRLLGSADGYLWQGDVMASLDWSAAKTSRVLSSLEDDGRITRHEIGRRKAVCLPHREPAVLREPVGPATSG